MAHIAAVIMAAGLGKRMRSKKAKVMHPVAGRPMIWYMINVMGQLVDSKVVLVLGHGAEQVHAYVDKQQDLRASIDVVQQPTQLGTGDAVKQAQAVLMPDDEPLATSCLIVNGDTPLLTASTLQCLLMHHQAEQAMVTMLTTNFPDPHGYGRVVRSVAHDVIKIVEDRDATPEELAIHEVNVGTYVVDSQFLFNALNQIEPRNAQGEYYLTDIVSIAVQEEVRVSAVKTQDATECWGINTREHLALAEQAMRGRIRTHWLREGVTMLDPATTMIDDGVQLGQDTVLHPHVTLEGQTTIGEDCVIRAHTRITDSQIGNCVVVEDCCVMEKAVLEDGASVGPFARLRAGTVLQQKAKVGNFVEVKNTVLGEGSKAGHLSYLGDGIIGKHVNVGAGTITCNYDGFRKSQTVIEDGVFIGSGSQLIAPVTIGQGAVVAAGSTITDDVPSDAVSLSRVEQENRKQAAARRRDAQTKASDK
ncbi:MAG: UDP-N-acetylglucosamine diphosphorylase/glucosamine-1-phosphate N-acetyltransferase [Nitrospirales bacterium]|nr:UDP-N-acetylglucosamine diphosphorylase/glucosamine-1-phosphate N-acetyltransferase [Nitrospirales bacterium]